MYLVHFRGDFRIGRGDQEVKYFSSLLKWLDLDWYLSHFIAGSDRVKGEASPSYALLPVERIELIRQLSPRLGWSS
jgi:hypothetical protein